MDLAKKPELLLSVCAIAISLGSTFYTHKRIQDLQSSMEKIQKYNDNIGKRVSNMDTTINELHTLREQAADIGRTCLQLQTEIRNVQENIQSFIDPQLADNEMIQTTINALIDALGSESVDPIELQNVNDFDTFRKRGRRKPAIIPKKESVVRETETDEEKENPALVRLQALRAKNGKKMQMNR